MIFSRLTVVLLALLPALSGIVINALKKGADAEILHTRDENTLRLFRLTYPLVLVLSVLIFLSGIGARPFPGFIVMVGALLFVIGFVVRWTAVISLGKAFTVRVVILKQQRLKTDGIYSLVRHPSYTGLLMYYTGLGCIMQNWISLLLLVLVPLFVILYRIRLEERVLTDHFGAAYLDYSRRTWRLIPFVY